MLSAAVSFLLQFSFFALALGAPVGDVSIQSNAWQYGTGGGIVGLIVLVLDIIVGRKSSFKDPKVCCSLTI